MASKMNEAYEKMIKLYIEGKRPHRPKARTGSRGRVTRGKVVNGKWVRTYDSETATADQRKEHAKESSAEFAALRAKNKAKRDAAAALEADKKSSYLGPNDPRV